MTLKTNRRPALAAVPEDEMRPTGIGIRTSAHTVDGIVFTLALVAIAVVPVWAVRAWSGDAGNDAGGELGTFEW
jgi:hypothetical protein